MSLENKTSLSPERANSLETEIYSEIGLPKSCLTNYIRSLLAEKELRGDKIVYQLMDKIAIRYIKYLSSLGCSICLEEGKKTLNIEHILKALEQMNLKKYIPKLVEGQELQEEQDDKEVDKQKIKSLINKDRKTSRKRKNKFGTEAELEEAKRRQNEMFAQAKFEYNNSNIFSDNIEATNERKEEHTIKEDINNINNYELGMDLFGNNKNEDINFD